MINDPIFLSQKSETASKDKNRNTSYIFIPFCFEKKDNFREIIKCIDANGSWKLKHDNIKYMFKFVADKFDSKNPERCLCFHYTLENTDYVCSDIFLQNEWICTERHIIENKEQQFKFKINNVHMHCFSTSVGIMAFNVSYESSEPMYVSTAQYFLKKVSREKLFCEKIGKFFTFMELARIFTDEINRNFSMNFFYYSNSGTQRANMLTYIESDYKEDFSDELFYLRKCYASDFPISKSAESEKQGIHKALDSIQWGFSDEAAVCIACPEKGREGFVKNTFFSNFNEQYLFMYVFLLHQKYVLYLFLTQIGEDLIDGVDKLENYRRRLNGFETDFVFSRITEVPQYQELYDKILNAFALKEMYIDVNEPLKTLDEIQRQKAEELQNNNEKSLTRTLAVLSLLSVFSALVDSFDFIREFGSLMTWSSMIINIVQIVLIVLILTILVYVVIKVVNPRK